MRVRSVLLIGIAVLVVGVLVGIGAAVVSTGQRGAGPRVATSAASPSPSPVASTPPASPTPTPAFGNYVALGDSYAAGMGVGGERGKCRRSDRGYPNLFSKAEGMSIRRNVTCSGATTADVQRDQVSALNKRTDLVTLTVGGNDLDVATVADACAGGVTHACRTKFRKSLSLLDVLPDRLAATYSAILDAAPHARLVVTGYPLMFTMPPTDSPKFSTIAFANAATASLDQVVKTAVKKKRSRGANISYVPISFSGHRIGDPHPWINPSGRDAFHPTADGYVAMAKALEGALARSKAD